CQQGYNNPWTF
nr:immunoglobulin light chain junction region [Macaca mulatta]MOW52546.1 immunoglobulin light chain junction region [Macaca mulatta]